MIFVLCVAAIFLGEDSCENILKLDRRVLVQDSDLHSLVVAVTVAYLISDGLWILLQPDMVGTSAWTIFRRCKNSLEVRTPKSIIAHHVAIISVRQSWHGCLVFAECCR